MAEIFWCYFLLFSRKASTLSVTVNVALITTNMRLNGISVYLPFIVALPNSTVRWKGRDLHTLVSVEPSISISIQIPPNIPESVIIMEAMGGADLLLNSEPNTIPNPI